MHSTNITQGFKVGLIIKQKWPNQAMPINHQRRNKKNNKQHTWCYFFMKCPHGLHVNIRCWQFERTYQIKSPPKWAYYRIVNN